MCNIVCGYEGLEVAVSAELCDNMNGALHIR